MGKKKKKPPRARPLVNDLRVKPTAAAAAAAARELGAARVDVDGGAGAGARGGRAARSPARQGEAPAACAVAARVMWAGFFFFSSPPPPPPCSLLGKGWGAAGAASLAPACCLLTDRGFFFSPSIQPYWSAPREKRRFPNLLPSPRLLTPPPSPSRAPPSRNLTN